VRCRVPERDVDAERTVAGERLELDHGHAVLDRDAREHPDGQVVAGERQGGDLGQVEAVRRAAGGARDREVEIGAVVPEQGLRRQRDGVGAGGPGRGHGEDEEGGEHGDDDA
jgi:hypothetical protein